MTVVEPSPSPRTRLLLEAGAYGGAVLAAFLATGALIGLLGYDVLDAYSTILLTSFRNTAGLVETLNKFVPLLLQALAFTVPFVAGKFNIGGEGQLLVGAVAATAVGILWSALPGPVLVPVLLAVGVGAGAVWAGIAAWLLDRFGINEILTTVLLNFVAFAMVHYVASEVWSNPAAGHPTTVPIARAGYLPLLWAPPPLHSGLLLALGAALAVIVGVRWTPRGFELRAVGSNARAAAVHGVGVRGVVVGSLVLGGALGGLSGAVEVAGVHHKLIEGMHSNYLLLGIIAGLIARGSVLALPAVAFFIAVLEVGADALQRTVGLPSEMVLLVEALVMLFVLLSDLLRGRLGRRRWKPSS